MRIFNQLVFDGYVSGTANSVYSDPQYQPLLGLSDQLSISGYTAQATGTSPTLTVQVEQSFDSFRWLNRQGTPEINGTALSTTGETNVQGQDGNPTSRPTLAFARLKITLGGTSPTAQVRLWVTGRDRSEG